MSIIEKFEVSCIKKLTKDKTIPEFKAGDTVRVHNLISEGDKERIQNFEGFCISKVNKGLKSKLYYKKNIQ